MINPCPTADELNSGWFSPKGDMYPCAVYDHLLTAYRITTPFGEEKEVDLPKLNWSPSVQLLKSGWVRCMGRTIEVHHLKNPETITALRKYLERLQEVDRDKMITLVYFNPLRRQTSEVLDPMTPGDLLKYLEDFQ